MVARRAAVLILMALAWIAALSPAAAQTFPARGRQAVVDTANIIPDAAEAALNQRLIAWSQSSGHQLVVVTVPDLQGRPVEDYGVALGRHWQIGSTADNGVLLIVSVNPRKVRIEVGRGLEGVLTDAVTSGIIREDMRPALSRNDYAAGLTAGADRIMAVADAEPGTAVTPAQAVADPMPAGVPWVKYIIIAVVGGFVLLFLWPVIQDWYLLWPIYRILPYAGRRRANWLTDLDAEKARKKAEKDAWEAGAPARIADAERVLGKNWAKSKRWDPDRQAIRTKEEMRMRRRASAADRAKNSNRDRGWSGGGGWSDGGASSSSSSSSSSSGFDGGGGDFGGGGASSDY